MLFGRGTSGGWICAVDAPGTNAAAPFEHLIDGALLKCSYKIVIFELAVQCPVAIKRYPIATREAKYP